MVNGKNQVQRDNYSMILLTRNVQKKTKAYIEKVDYRLLGANGKGEWGVIIVWNAFSEG